MTFTGNDRIGTRKIPIVLDPGLGVENIKKKKKKKHSK